MRGSVELVTTSATRRCAIEAVSIAVMSERVQAMRNLLDSATRSCPRPRIGSRPHEEALVTSQKCTAERTKRERAIRADRRTSEREGSSSPPATRADQDAYVRGEIDVQQLGARVRARHGLG